MQQQVAVTVTAFGEGRYRVLLPPARSTVADALRDTGVETVGRRVAVNGHSALGSTTVVEGDQVTVVPRVEGG